ncbi:MAG TPA: YciI family protein [Polyangiales bacterium]|nr:YciI family protein [Polyangiales bacterium]
MKLMVMHKADAASETEPKPTQELLANVGNLVRGVMESGRLLDANGLRSSARRARVSPEGEVQRGPYAGRNELVANIAHLKVEDMDAAIDWGRRYARAAGAEVEVGMVTEPWDLGVAPKPEGVVPLQILALAKADLGSEQEARDLTAFYDEAKAAGVLVGAHALKPSAHGARISGPRGARQVVDGPFSEAKELIGGFMLMTFEDTAEAVDFARRYADVVGAAEVDVREVY